VGAGHDGADRIVPPGLDHDHAKEWCQGNLDACLELRGGAHLIEPEVVEVRFLEILGKSPYSSRGGVPAPVTGSEYEQTALEDVPGFRPDDLHRSEHRVRALREFVPQRLALREPHAIVRFVPPVGPSLGLAHHISRGNPGDGRGTRIEDSRPHVLGRGPDGMGSQNLTGLDYPRPASNGYHYPRLTPRANPCSG
jgi:hypothetical protein